MGIYADAVLFYGFMLDGDGNYSDLKGNTHALGVGVDYRGYEEDPVWYVRVKESKIMASLGNPQNINPAHFTIKDGWAEKLKAFSKRHKIKWQEPNWHLVSKLH